MSNISYHNIKIEQQTGAVLLTALVLLVIMTMLGITSMSTATLEEKMAANSQDINRSFQTAETGLEMVFNDDNAFNTGNTTVTDGTAADIYTPAAAIVGNYLASVTYNSILLQAIPAPRGSGWNPATTSFYYFNQSATSNTQSGSTSTINGGAYQIGKK